MIILPVPTWELLYLVSDRAEVLSMRAGRWLSPVLDKSNGYYQVMLCEGPRRDIRYLHELVLTTFEGPCPPGMEARHLTGDKSVNWWKYLKWGTPAQNGQDRIDHGTSARGERNARHKLTEQDARDIKSALAAGVSPSVLARYHRVSVCCIGDIRHGRNWAWL